MNVDGDKLTPAMIAMLRRFAAGPYRATGAGYVTTASKLKVLGLVDVDQWVRNVTLTERGRRAVQVLAKAPQEEKKR